MSRQGRVGCKHCNWKGYAKHSFWNGEKEEFTVTVCSQCNDTRGYHAYVRQKYGKQDNLRVLEGGEPIADVIDFQKYKENQELKYYGKEESDQLGKKQFQEFGKIPRRE